MKHLFTLLGILVLSGLFAQTSYYGMTSRGGVSNEGTIFKTDSTGSNLQTVFSFKYHHAGRRPESVFTQASNGKIYGTTKYGGANICSFPIYGGPKHSGVIFEYNPTNGAYTVLFNFDDTASGCWPETAPVLASNGKLYGVTRAGGSASNKGAVYSYDLSSGTFTKLHAFSGANNDGEFPVGNLLLASNGKLYGITSSGGFNDKGIIFQIDPATNTYTKKLDLQNGWSGNKAAQDAKAGLIQAPNGIIYGTSSQGGNYPSGYQYAYGNIFKYDPSSNVATNLYGFSDSGLGKNPEGAPVLIGTNSLYCITHMNYQIPGTYNTEPHFYLWKYTISSNTATVVDSIANGTFNFTMVKNTSGKIIITGKDYNISSAIRFWEFNPSTNTRTLLDTSTNIKYIYNGFMLASNGKYYGGGAYPDANNPYYSDADGSMIEYDATNHVITEKFKFSEPIDGLEPMGDLLMATNGKFYGMTSKGGTYDRGVVFEFNPANDSYIKKFDLDSFTGYEPKGGLMEASNGKLYGLTYKGGNNGYGTIIQIDTNTWTLSKKADFSTSVGIRPMGRMVEAWNGKLYGLTYWNGGTIFQFDTTTNSITKKHSFTSNDGTAPKGSLALADNGKLYGLTQYGGQNYYSQGTLFEFDPATNTFAMKKEMFNYTGYNSQGNTPLQGSDGKMYLLLSCGGSGNTMYAGGAIDEYIPGATTVTNKAVFSVNNTGSKPMGDLMESANGKMYAYSWIGGTNNKGTLFEYNPVTATITKKVDFNGTNGANPVYGSLTESNTSAITLSQQPTISSVCVGDTAFLSVAASHATLLHYQWYKNNTRIAGATNDTLTFNGIVSADSGTYYCKITGGTRAVMSNSFTLSPVNKPIVNISNLSNAYCADASDVNLSATPNGGTFSGNVSNGNVFSPSNLGAGSYNVFYTYTDAQGCSNMDTVSVTVNALPNAGFAGYVSSYCDNGELDTLVPIVSGGTFSGPGITANIFDPSYFASSTALVGFPKFKYTITDANNCTNTDSVSVSIYHAPVVTLSGLDTVYCSNESVDTLVTNPIGGTITAGSFLNGNLFNPAYASTTASNNIYYSYTNSHNCTNYDTLTITVHAAPDASFSGLSTSYCVNNDADTLVPAQLGGSFGGDISSGNIFDPKSVSIPGGALSSIIHISYTITDNNNCTNSDTLSSTIYPLPIVNFGSLDTAFCDNDSPVSLVGKATPTGGVFTGNGVSGNSFDPQQAGLGSDTLIYTFTNSNNCTNSDSAYTNIYPAPVFHLADDTTICINNVLTLSTGLNAGYIFLWSDGSTGPSLTINASSLGTGTYTYSVLVKNANTDCEETDEIKITINPCTGIDVADKLAKEVIVYPNPSKGLFSIESDINIKSYELYSAQAKLLIKGIWDAQNNILKLDLRDKNPGVYYLLLNNGETIIRKQLIIR